MTNLEKIISDPTNAGLVKVAIEEYFESHMAFNTKKNRLTRCNDTDCNDCAFKSNDGYGCSQKSVKWLHSEAKDGE